MEPNWNASNNPGMAFKRIPRQEIVRWRDLNKINRKVLAFSIFEFERSANLRHRNPIA